MSTSQIFRQLVLTLIPSQRDTALRGLKARRVLIDLNAGISAAPNQIAAKFTNDNYKTIYYRVQYILFTKTVTENGVLVTTLDNIIFLSIIGREMSYCYCTF